MIRVVVPYLMRWFNTFGYNDWFMKIISEFEEIIRCHGRVTFEIAGSLITLDLKNRHERAYAAKLLLDIQCPQIDIDIFLFEKFIKPLDSVLDAGANIGFTALECIRAGAERVVAVEALPELYERLEKLTHRKLVSVRAAVSSSPGEADLFVSIAHNQGASLKQEMIEIFPSVFGETVQKEKVELTTIDKLVEVFGSFDIWKLDVEGAESDALLGALHTLKLSPPRIIIVELFDRFYDEFHSLAKVTHPFVCRALISKESYQMELHPPFKGFPSDFCHTSPMYVFSSFPFENI